MPIDPDYPKPWLEFVVKDARPRLLIAQRRDGGELWQGENILYLDDLAFQEPPGSVWDANPDRRATGRTLLPSNAAYIIYTSGSTGNPKGVIVSHHSIVNKAAGIAARFTINGSYRVAWITSPAFDPSLWQTLPPLLFGGSVVVVHNDLRASPEMFWDHMARTNVKVINAAPSGTSKAY